MSCKAWGQDTRDLATRPPFLIGVFCPLDTVKTWFGGYPQFWLGVSMQDGGLVVGVDERYPTWLRGGNNVTSVLQQCLRSVTPC